jgi:thiamine pyrophosphate-dependent acetolactate synthase large subunit-like protein
MISRAAATECILRAMGANDFVVCGLGYLSREFYARSERVRDRCLYCMGSMGSVVPVSLGISLARPSVRVLAVEGDGSLLMNLGTLSTLRRYGSPRVRLLVFDNGCYESTGGQPSQAEGFRLERMCAAADLYTTIATETSEIETFLGNPQAIVLIIKVARGGKTRRIDETPEYIAARFARSLRQSAAITP